MRKLGLTKVTTGVKRCGESTLMTQYQDVLRKENSKISILAINLDMPYFRFIAKKLEGLYVYPTIDLYVTG